MTFNDALQMIIGSDTSRNAAKRPSWRGYMMCTNYTAADGTNPESFKIKLVTSAYSGTGDAAPANIAETTTSAGADTTAGTNDDVGVYVIGYSGGVWTLPTTPSKQLVVDAQLWGGFVADDWIVGSISEYETVRAGGTGRW